jgi:exopolysaccharide biosynthesis polyprenyl glycosylphosphotransferase
MTELVRGVEPPASTAAVELSTTAAQSVEMAARPDETWTYRYGVSLVVADAAAVAAASVVGWLAGFGVPLHSTWHFYLATSYFMALGWLACLHVVGAYEVRRISTGAREFQRVLKAAANAAGSLAIVAFLGHIAVARSFVAVVIPVGAVFMLIARYAVRQGVKRRRAAGRWTSTILAVGTSESVKHLVATTHRNPFAGLRVIGACVEDTEPGGEIAPDVPVLGDVAHAAELAESVGADIVAVAGSGLGPRRIRELGWALEGTGRNMVMAPGLTDVAGPRLHISPVEGLPLMWVDQPQFSGTAQLIKRVVDLVGASILLVLCAPFLLLIGLLVRLTSSGPAFYRSTRMGAHGREFTVFKFRSMYVGADKLRCELEHENEADGVLFKIRADPRVTPVGRLLRKYSLDELPQLFNVLGGSMSLVGPRPPLPDEVKRYHEHVRRRLLVKPGMTGLWQVSGRSDLPWEEAVRLDLYYVENWSLALDLVIILRTIWAVLRGRGAY